MGITIDKSMKKVIAFDLDGTLIDVSQRDYHIYCNIIKKQGGLPILYEIYWEQRRNKTNIFDILEQSGIVNGEGAKIFLQERSKLMERASYLAYDRLLPSVIKTLQDIQNTFDVCIITKRNDEKATMLQLQEIGLDIFPTFIVQENKKAQMAAINNLVAMVGDTESDIIPANELGIISIGVLSGIRNKTMLDRYEPAYIINSVVNIEEILPNL